MTSMLNAIIRFSLNHRLLIIVAALAVIIGGSMVTRELPIDVLPDLTRPRVVLLTEAPGYAPEEVETLITFPLEAALNGATGVQAVRTSSDIGLSLIYVEFDWGANQQDARQTVQERIAVALDQLPEGIRPQMGPQSSLLGQIMLIGMWSEDGTTKSMELRTLADWVVRQRLRTIEGVSQVIVMGGGRKQFHVLVDPHLLHQHEVSLAEVKQGLVDSNLNVTGGYLQNASIELLARGIGRLRNSDDIRKVVVKSLPERPVLMQDVARVIEAPQPKRGDSSVNGKAAVVLTIQKQPGFDTRALTEEINTALAELREGLPPDVVLEPTYQQREFIDFSVQNVIEALRDGAILVVLVLFFFLLNFRTTLITLTAIPLSILTTALVFRWFGLSINVMTLGGIAVALGELVDDAIVDVENIFRRLKQNAQRETPRPVLRVIYEASSEVRGAIIMSTILVVLVFAPLFALSGMQGRLFVPLGIAYIVSISVSTLVSLTVTPVLSRLLLPKARSTQHRRDGVVLRILKRAATPLIRLSMNGTGLAGILLLMSGAAAVAVLLVLTMGQEFLPKFDEGATQVNVFLKPGTSLQTSTRIAGVVNDRFAALQQTDQNPTGPIRHFTCRTGRAGLDEHVMGVNVSEYVLSLNPDSGMSREKLIETLHEELKDVPGVDLEIEQPIAHLISHMLSGVQAEIAIKLFGDDLDVLRRKSNEIKRAIEKIDGIAPPFVEQQQQIPQLRIEVDRDAIAEYGLSVKQVNEFVETALNGRVITTLLDGQRTFDVVVRLDDAYRDDYTNLDRLIMELDDGRVIPLSEVARVFEGAGPNTINREDTRRRVVVRVNTKGRDLGSAVREIQAAIEREIEMPEGYFVVYGGQFEASQAATFKLLVLSAIALVGVFVVLFSAFPSLSVVLQILLALPAAFVGGVFALKLSGQPLSVASMVGFISLGGIAARNGILLVEHYIALYREHGFTREMILQGSLERLAPVLMTALTTGLGLIPLVIGGHLPGKEILYPVATVILGGLITSTLCELLIRPGLFWFLARKATPRLATQEAERLS